MCIGIHPTGNPTIAQNERHQLSHPGLSLLGMPFLVPGSRMSMALRAPPVSHAVFIVNVYQPSDTSQVNFPASPPQSECESVTPRSQPYLNTPPILDADIFDTVPFSVRTHR
jgi:hypothetical protein